MDVRVLYVTPFAVAAVGILVLAAFTWRRRQVRGAGLLFFLCLAASLWSVTEGLLYLGFSHSTNLLLTYVQYLGIVTLPPVALVFVLTIFGLGSSITRPRIIILICAATLILIGVWTNETHHLHFTETHVIYTGEFPMMGLTHGPLWYAVIVYHYLLILTATIITISVLRSSANIYRKQAFILLVSLSAVWMVNAIYVAGFSPVPNMDIGPIAFALVAAAFAWGFFRYNLLDIIPVAKEEVFDNLEDQVIIIDRNLRVVDFNSATEELFGIKRSTSLGRDVEDVFADYPMLVEAAGRPGDEEISIETAAEPLYFDMKIKSLEDRKKHNLGWLVMLHDVTERKALEDELQQLASTDGLTGARNRRYLFELAGNEFQRARRYSRDCCVVILDIDQFKHVNDDHGHNIGDQALKELARVCQEEIRAEDLFGRIGGEEFVVVLPDQSLDQALHVSERLRLKIEGIGIETPRGTVGITASLGVSSLQESDGSFDDILKRADTALYHAKTAGKNCVRSYQVV